MYCRQCNVTVDCTADRCPLCGGTLEKSGKPTSPDLPSPKGSVKKQRLDYFSKVYIPVAILVMAISLTVNLLVNPTFLWSVIVIVSLSYIYFLVRFTFIAQGNFNKRIFHQTIILTVIFFILRFTVGGNHWIFITWLPIVYFLSEFLMGIYFIVTYKASRSRIASLFLLGFLGAIPVCTAFLLDLSHKWPSIAASAFSVLLMIIIIIAERKQIATQLKRFLHV